MMGNNSVSKDLKSLLTLLPGISNRCRYPGFQIIADTRDLKSRVSAQPEPTPISHPHNPRQTNTPIPLADQHTQPLLDCCECNSTSGDKTLQNTIQWRDFHLSKPYTK